MLNLEQMRPLIVKIDMFVKLIPPFVKYISIMRKLLILFLIVISPIVAGKTYFVAPSGGSDLFPGTINQPWATWQRAFNVAQAGDTVYFRGGVWYLQPDQTVQIMPHNGVGHSGAANNYIHYLNYPGETPILDGRDIIPKQPAEGQFTYSGGLYIDNAHYLHWKGLTVRNFKMVYERVFVQGIVASDAHFQIFENITVHDIEGRAFSYSPGYAPDSTYFINVDAYNCGDVLPLNDVIGGWGDGWNAGVERGSYMLFDGCRAWNCSDDGFNIYGPGFIEMRNCWSWNNGPEFGADGDGSGFKLNPTENLEVTELTRYIHNCIAAFNNGFGINENNMDAASMNGKIYNNTTYANICGFMTGGRLIGAQKNNDYRNNIATASTHWQGMEVDQNIGTGGVWYTNIANTWTPGITFSVSDEDFVLTDSLTICAQLSAPRKPDGSLPDITAFKLAAGSDLIDKGVNVGLPYSGPFPDLGYSEFNSGTMTPVTPSYISSVIENITPARLDMVYNQTMANVAPAVSAFIVKVNSTTRTVSSVAVSGTKVMLTLASPVLYGDIVTVTYTKPSTNPLQTPAGGQAASFTAQNVINNCSPSTNQPPLVTITSPTKSLTTIAPATITIEATASDSDGSVVRLEFFSDNTKIGESTSLPYSYSWKNVMEGTYTVYAVATDNLNAKTVSETVRVVVEKSSQTVNELPVVAVTYSKPGKSPRPKKHDNIVLEASVYDPDGSILSVEFKNGNVTMAIVSEYPYTYTMQDIDTGKFIITAVATDNQFASSVSSPLIINVTENEENQTVVSLFPNPNNGLFSIDIHSFELNEEKQISIFDLSGKPILEDVLADGEAHREFDLSTATPGTYILMISSAKQIISTKKFLKR